MPRPLLPFLARSRIVVTAPEVVAVDSARVVLVSDPAAVVLPARIVTVAAVDLAEVAVVAVRVDDIKLVGPAFVETRQGRLRAV